jgi:protein-tyrosine kinase
VFRPKSGQLLENNNNKLIFRNFLKVLSSSSEIAQSYEALLSNLHLLNSTQPLKILLVTSAQPGEGKTTVTINLVLTAALAGKKGLVIDTDLRRPKINHIFNLENTLGFTDVLTGNLGIQDTIQTVELPNDAFQNKQTISVITSGKISPNSFSIARSATLNKHVDYLRTMYDLVLLDTPPVLSVSDTLLLAPVVDGIILVLNTGVVTERDARLVKERLEQAGGHIIGVVMNRFNVKMHGPGFHPYSSYYYHVKL